MAVMLVLRFIEKAKRLVEAGRWADGGPRTMPKTAFPLSRTRSFQLGKKWRWRVDRLDVDGVEARLLTAIEPGKEKFLAWLSVKKGEDYAIVARYEFHGAGEPGWHGHSLCGRLADIPVAVVKPYGTMRIPQARRRHRRGLFGVTESNAIAISFKKFRVSERPEDVMI